MFIVTELLCDNLYEFLRKNRQSADPVYFTVGRIRHVAQQCLVALKFLHAVGIIHSDLKPENIVLADIERADIKIIDFGSSCFLHDTLGTYVQSRSYRAPEVFLGVQYDYRIDVVRHSLYYFVQCTQSYFCS
jgi:serine/threonine protein kinase|eukprot:SAG25_NODE_9_length_28981_cov_95.245274_16_plen_132_part_00